MGEGQSGKYRRIVDQTHEIGQPRDGSFVPGTLGGVRETLSTNLRDAQEKSN